MSDTRTPGQLCYEAYCALTPRLYPTARLMAWDEMLPVEHRAWEAAAEAVITAWIASPDWPTPPPEDTP
jgi:hypothetical protein